MPSRDKEQRQAAIKLQDARAKHVILLAKVKKTHAKLERRRRKLQTLEAKIARLERSAAEPEKRRLGQAATKNDKLRPARLIFNPDSGNQGPRASSKLVDIEGRTTPVLYDSHERTPHGTPKSQVSPGAARADQRQSSA
jgi:hypothetical protein